MNSLNFQCFEGSFLLYPTEDSTRPITVESWFIQRDLTTMRRTLYKVYSGQVVAFQDQGVCGDNRLHIESVFLESYMYEPELDVILKDSGVLDLNKVATFSMRTMG